MAKAKLKTRATKASVKAYLDGLESDRRKDCKVVAKMMAEATGKRAKM